MKNSQSKIKVAWFCDDIDRQTKGQATYSKKLIEQLVKNFSDQIDLTLVHRQGKCRQAVCQLARNLTIKTFKIPFFSGIFSWLWFFLTTREKFDIFHVPRHNLYPGFLIAKLRGKIKHFVVTLHGAPDKNTPRIFRKAGSWWNWHIKYFAKYFVDKFLAVSQVGQKQIIDYYKIKPSKVDYFHISCKDEFQESKKAKKQESKEAIKQKYGIKFPYILHVGRFDPHKNIHRLIEAYAQLQQGNQFKHYLVLVGGRHLSHYSDQIEKLIKEKNLNQQVIIVQDVVDEDMPILYSLADLSVNFSLNEGFGLPILEAMKTGAPLVVSDIPVYREVAGDAAFYVSPFKLEEIANGMLTVLSNISLKEDLRKRGFKRGQFFNWPEAARALIEIYKNL